jgi:hypothetical protein
MMELTIQYNWGQWIVMSKEHKLGMYSVYIQCQTSDEAMEILQQLNGKPYEVIDAFHRTRDRLSRNMVA